MNSYSIQSILSQFDRELRRTHNGAINPASSSHLNAGSESNNSNSDTISILDPAIDLSSSDNSNESINNVHVDVNLQDANRSEASDPQTTTLAMLQSLVKNTSPFFVLLILHGLYSIIFRIIIIIFSILIISSLEDSIREVMASSDMSSSRVNGEILKILRVSLSSFLCIYLFITWSDTKTYIWRYLVFISPLQLSSSIELSVIDTIWNVICVDIFVRNISIIVKLSICVCHPSFSSISNCIKQSSSKLCA
jgi:hypothetical protein